jgi:hypothetical protein
MRLCGVLIVALLLCRSEFVIATPLLFVSNMGDDGEFLCPTCISHPQRAYGAHHAPEQDT